MNRTLIDKARALVKEARLAQRWLGAALLHASVLNYRAAMSLHNMKIPHELPYGRSPRNKYMKIFGCGAYLHDHERNRKTKFTDRTVLPMYVWS